MPHENTIVFNNNSFIDNLPNYLEKDQLTTSSEIFSSAAVDNWLQEIDPGNVTSEVAVLDAFFSFFDTSKERLPTTFKGLLERFIQFIENDTNPTLVSLGVSVDDPSPDGPIFDGFVETYRELLGIGSDISTSEWANLPVTDLIIREQAREAINHFLSNYPYQEVIENGEVVGFNVGTTIDFYREFYKFLTTTAHLESDTDSGDVDIDPDAMPGTGDELNISMNAFESVYLAYGFTQGDFPQKLEEFYRERVKANGGVEENGVLTGGFFIPSQEFHEWWKEIRKEYLEIVSASSVDAPQREADVVIIDKILRLLIDMIDVLHRVSATQSQRLSFLAGWQSDYTELMTDVPTFTSGDNTRIGKDDRLDNDADEKVRGKLNPKMSSLLEEIRARRSVVQDDAKAMQSVINQSQDSANQQTNIATAILQQLSTILGAIYR